MKGKSNRTSLEEIPPAHYMIIDKLKKLFMCTFSQMTYLMSHITYLNNTHEWFYESPCNGFKDIPPKQFGGKLGPK